MSGLLHRARFWRDHRWAPRRMSAYLDDELPAAQRARLERHSDECRQCRGLLRDLRRMLDRLHALAPGGARAVPDIAAGVRARLRESPRR